jgi:hypothetical protein
MSGTTNGAVAPDDDGGIPADLLADGSQAPELAEEDAASKSARELAELRAQNAAQRDMIHDLSRRSREQGDAVAEIRDLIRSVNDRSREAQDRGYDLAIDDIRNRIVRAASDADPATAAALMADLDVLTRNRPKVAEPAKKTADKPDAQTVTPDPATLEWLQSNPWFNADDELRDYAMARDQRLGIANPNMPIRERLAKVKEETVKRFPDKFPNEGRRNAPAAVSRPGAQTTKVGKPRAKTEADLPTGARAAMERFVRQGVLTKEQYLKDYQWDKD